MRKVRILISSSPALSQVIDHLFRGRSEFEIVGRVNGLRTLRRESARLTPELIVADVKPIATRLSIAAASIRSSSPSSKLILICSVRELMGRAPECGADACVEQEKLVQRLLPAVRALSALKPKS